MLRSRREARDFGRRASRSCCEISSKLFNNHFQFNRTLACFEDAAVVVSPIWTRHFLGTRAKQLLVFQDGSDGAGAFQEIAWALFGRTGNYFAITQPKTAHSDRSGGRIRHRRARPSQPPHLASPGVAIRERFLGASAGVGEALIMAIPGRYSTGANGLTFQDVPALARPCAVRKRYGGGVLLHGRLTELKASKAISLRFRMRG